MAGVQTSTAAPAGPSDHLTVSRPVFPRALGKRCLPHAQTVYSAACVPWEAPALLVVDITWYSPVYLLLRQREKKKKNASLSGIDMCLLLGI